MPREQTSPNAVARVETLIFTVRGERVILDSDLARIYGVTTKRLNQQVRRNLERFPDDFVFQLTKDEFDRLKLQNATSKQGVVVGVNFLLSSQSWCNHGGECSQ